MNIETIFDYIVKARKIIGYIPGSSVALGLADPILNLVLSYGKKGLEVFSIIARAIPIALPEYTPPSFQLIKKSFAKNPPLAELYANELASPKDNLFRLQSIYEDLFYCIDVDTTAKKYEKVPNELIISLSNEFNKKIEETKEKGEEAIVLLGLSSIKIEQARELMNILKEIIPEAIKMKEIEPNKLLKLVNEVITKEKGEKNA